MNSPAPGRSKVVSCSTDTARLIVDMLDQLPESYWLHRPQIHSIPTQGTRDSDYWFLSDRGIPREMRALLEACAPKIKGAMLDEVCVNRYLPGGGMPEHIDSAFVRFNLVVALNDCGDGVEISGTFYPDVPGEATVFPLRSEPHRVPPVKHKRYVLIYLYD